MAYSKMEGTGEHAIVATFSKLSSWTGGFEGQVTLANPGPAQVRGWTLTFRYPGAFTWLAGVQATSRKGNEWVWKPAEWNSVLEAGSTKVIGFGGTTGILSDLKLTPNLVPAPAPAPVPAPAPGPLPPSKVRWPERYVAPYCDVMLWPTPSLADIAQATGLRFFTLAFVVAGPDGSPAWGGITPTASRFMADRIRALRSAGGDVCISFGGANGTELACKITSVDDLVRAYQSVVDAYGCTRLDFDIEGAACADRPSIVRRNKALARLCANNGGKLVLSYTLPALGSGLTSDGLYVLQSAAQCRVPLRECRAMAMDFGPPVPDMAAEVVSAATSVRAQIATVPGLANTKIGIIPMIGENDIPREVFDLTDAEKVVSWASKTPWVKMLSYWSVARDKTGAPGRASCDGSGVTQAPCDFARRFASFG